jgi:catechol-2,3-dioxygenase
MNGPIRPRTFAHVVYRTRRFDAMLDWYLRVFEGKLQHKNEVIAFLTYDDEHHRIALLNFSILKGPEGQENVPRGEVGVDHLAYGFASLTALMEKYDQLRKMDIKPYWCIHHGITISLYYADPDGNQMEFQVDCFPSNEEANAFMRGPHFAVNPIGVEFDADDMLARLRAGEPEQSFLPRVVQLPVSEVRGSAAG